MTGKNTDPTRAEMEERLRPFTFAEMGDRFDKEEAMYWFAYEQHGGQTSNLYSVLSTSDYRPGPITKGPEPDSMGAMMLEDLREAFGVEVSA